MAMLQAFVAMQGEAPTINLVIGYSNANTSQIVSHFFQEWTS